MITTTTFKLVRSISREGVGVEHYAHPLNEIDLAYIKDLIDKDLRYQRTRKSDKKFRPRKGHTDADVTKIRERAHLSDKLAALLGQMTQEEYDERGNRDDDKGYRAQATAQRAGRRADRRHGGRAKDTGQGRV